MTTFVILAVFESIYSPDISPLTCAYPKLQLYAFI